MFVQTKTQLMYERGTMMKKLMVLSLVLAIGAISSAALELKAPAEVLPGEAFQIIVGGTTPYNFAGGLYGDVANVVDAVGLQGNGTTGAFEAEFGGWEFTVGEITTTGFADVPDGNWLVFNAIAGAAGETYGLELWDYNVSMNAPVLTALVSVIPEPMTMGLLGLGALFLRRRK